MNTQPAELSLDTELPHPDFHHATILDEVTLMSSEWFAAMQDEINTRYIKAVSTSLNARDLPWWSGFAHHAIPSPIIRVDGERIMEIEARPDGILVMDMILGRTDPNAQQMFRAKVRETLQEAGCPAFVQFGTVVDDTHFAEIAELPHHTYDPRDVAEVPLQDLSWIRSDTETTYSDLFYHLVDGCSLVPNQDDGNKEYLLHMQETSATLYDYNVLLRQGSFPWDTGFVLKRLHHAARGNDVVVYKGDALYDRLEDKVRAKGKVDALLRKFNDLRELMIQAYVAPKEVNINGSTRYAIPRTFWCWNFKRGRYEYLAGLMNASSDGEVINGIADDACFWNITPY